MSFVSHSARTATVNNNDYNDDYSNSNSTNTEANNGNNNDNTNGPASVAVVLRQARSENSDTAYHFTYLRARGPYHATASERPTHRCSCTACSLCRGVL